MSTDQRKLYIADWHYGHKNAIAFDNRPFSNTDDMDAELVRRWNEAVRPCDSVYVIGDMFWCTEDKALPILKELNGQKFLIRGNHDRNNNSKFIHQFAKVSGYMEVDDNGNRIVLCHYPIPCFKNHMYGWYHFYGHVHTSLEWNITQKCISDLIATENAPCNAINVGAMMPYMDYTPRTFEEIAAHIPQFVKIDYGKEDDVT